LARLRGETTTRRIIFFAAIAGRFRWQTRLLTVFDVLLSARPYKKPWPMPAAIAAIEFGAGKQFDPELVAAFLRVLPECQKIAAEFADA
jgi:response regulator RpfG family c-di-GMP phosphodiesterase